MIWRWSVEIESEERVGLVSRFCQWRLLRELCLGLGSKNKF